MKTARIHGFGETLRIDEVDEPSPGAGGTAEAPERTNRALSEVLGELAGGRLRVPIGEILPLESAPEAHRRIVDREVHGKLLLQP